MTTLKDLATKSHAVALKQAIALKDMTVPVNFYCSKLVDSSKRVFAFCLVFQPIL